MRVDTLVAFLVGLATGGPPHPQHTFVELAPTIPGLTTFNAGPSAANPSRRTVAIRHHGLLILHVWEPPRSLRRAA